jgi:hypothetical protein
VSEDARKELTDSPNPGMKAVYMGSSLLVLFLAIYRLLTASKRRL